MKGKGKIVSNKWIENCFNEQKKIPWRRFAVDRDDKKGDESEEEILCEWKTNLEPEEDSDDDMVVIDKRKIDKVASSSPQKVVIAKDDDDDDDIKETKEEQKENMEIDSDSSIDITAVECQAFKNKIFYLNEDLPASTVLKFKHIIRNMLGTLTKDPSKANYVITSQGKKLPKQIIATAEIVKDTWIQECNDLQAFIPTSRYLL